MKVWALCSHLPATPPLLKPSRISANKDTRCQFMIRVSPWSSEPIPRQVKCPGDLKIHSGALYPHVGPVHKADLMGKVRLRLVLTSRTNHILCIQSVELCIPGSLMFQDLRKTVMTNTLFFSILPSQAGQLNLPPFKALSEPCFGSSDETYPSKLVLKWFQFFLSTLDIYVPVYWLW